MTNIILLLDYTSRSAQGNGGENEFARSRPIFLIGRQDTPHTYRNATSFEKAVHLTTYCIGLSEVLTTEFEVHLHS